MNTEITLIAEQLKNVYEGEPWFGRSFKAILNDIDESVIFEKPNGQHSILELVWHMINWREFTISRRARDKEKSTHYFEENDWAN